MKFEKYIGEWSQIEEAKLSGKTYELWESNKWGSDAPNIITADGKVIIDDSYNGLAIDLGDYLDMDYDEAAKYFLD